MKILVFLYCLHLAVVTSGKVIQKDPLVETTLVDGLEQNVSEKTEKVRPRSRKLAVVSGIQNLFEKLRNVPWKDKELQNFRKRDNKKKLGDCQGAPGTCGQDFVCKRSTHQCIQGTGEDPIPGCIGTGKAGKGYCYNTRKPLLHPLSVCQGDCDSDSDCKSGLRCHQRGTGDNVPGCTGVVTEDLNYCVKLLGECQGHCEDDWECMSGLKCSNGLEDKSVVPGCAGTPLFKRYYCFNDSPIPLETQVPTTPTTNAQTSVQTEVPTTPATNAQTGVQTQVPTTPSTNAQTSVQTEVPTTPATNAQTGVQTQVPTTPSTNAQTSVQTEVPTTPATNAQTSVQYNSETPSETPTAGSDLSDWPDISVTSPFQVFSVDDAGGCEVPSEKAIKMKEAGFTKVACPFGKVLIGATDQYKDEYVLFGANVLANILDQDSDGIPDDPLVVESLSYKSDRGGAMLACGISQEEEQREWELEDVFDYTFSCQTWKGDYGGDESFEKRVFKGIMMEEAFHLIHQRGYAVVYPDELGIQDYTSSVIGRETARLQCVQPGYFHPENECPANSPREPGDAASSPLEPGAGDCTYPQCDVAEFYKMVLFLAIGMGMINDPTGPTVWVSDYMPQRQDEVLAMLSEEFKDMIARPELHQLQAPITGEYNA